MRKQIAVIGILIVCLMAGTAVFAKANIGFKGIGGKIGYVMPEDPVESTIGFGVVADLGTFTPQIAFTGDVMYWAKGYEHHDYEWSYSQIYISGTGKYFFNTSKGAKFQPYAGAGLEFVIGKIKSEYKGETGGFFDPEDTSDSDTEIGIHIVGGFKYPLDKSKYLFAEARYSMGGIDMFGIFGGAVFSMK